MSTDSADSWKKKYFTSLEGIESKERALNEIEGVLRLALSRLTLAAEGVDKGLDQQLSELRKTARGSFDKQRLERLIEAISDTVKRLDKNRSRSANPESRLHENLLTDTLIAVLDSVAFPKGMEKRAKELRRQLTEAVGNEQPKQQITLLARLIDESLASFGNETTSNDSGWVAGQPESEVKPAPLETGGNRLMEGNAGLSLGKELRTGLLQGLRQRDSGDDALTRIHRSLQEAKEEQELRTIAQTMTTLLTAANTINHGASLQELDVVSQATPPSAAHEILIQLLDNIAFPAELTERPASWS